MELAFSNLDDPSTTSNFDPDRFYTQQTAAVARLAPILLTANAATVAGFVWLAQGYFAWELLAVWGLLALVPSLLMLVEWWGHRFRGRSMDFAATRRWELYGAALGIVWAAFLPLFFETVSDKMKIVSITLVLAVYGIGCFTLARIPTAAILFCILLGSSLALNILKLGGMTGLAFAAFLLVYSIGVAGIILRSHLRTLYLSTAGQKFRKQKEIIALLLNDFELETSDWLWETDRGGQLTYVSQRLSGLAGKPPGEIAGRGLAEALGAKPDDPGWAKFAAAMQDRWVIEDCEVEMRAGGKNSWWQILAHPLRDEAGQFTGYRGVGRDITAERQIRLELTQAKEAAEKASAAKSQFLAVMSHELKTPLNAIVGFAELLTSNQADYLPDGTKADHLLTILDSARHLQELINDILDATRIEKGTMKLLEQEADAAELVEVAVKMCRDAAEKADATIVARISDGIEIKGDITRIKQVLINLIANAAKFSPPGGFVNVSFEQPVPGGLAIAVRDGGFGIKSEDIERIFEPFVQADEGMSRRFGGIGLGLAIARKIARLHGGDVTLQSEFGAGTTARLTLPAARVAWSQPQAQRASTAA